MFIVKILKFIGRLLVDFLFVLVAFIVAAITLSSFGFIGAVLLTVPLWFVFSWLYSRAQGYGKAAA